MFNIEKFLGCLFLYIENVKILKICEMIIMVIVDNFEWKVMK